MTLDSLPEAVGYYTNKRFVRETKNRINGLTSLVRTISRPTKQNIVPNIMTGFVNKAAEANKNAKENITNPLSPNEMKRIEALLPPPMTPQELMDYGIEIERQKRARGEALMSARNKRAARDQRLAARAARRESPRPDAMQVIQERSRSRSRGNTQQPSRGGNISKRIKRSKKLKTLKK